MILLTSEKMALQMLGMQICLVAMRARKFAVSILDGSGRGLGRAIDAVRHCGRSSWNTRKNASPSLRPNYLSARRLLGHVRSRCRRHGIRTSPHWSFTLRMAVRTRRHAIFGSSITRRRWGNKLRIRLSSGVWGHHAVRLIGLRRVGSTKEGRR